jgi:hypothetical protein
MALVVDNYSYGNALVTFDQDAEKRLLRKIDWMVIPTVTIVYLMSVPVASLRSEMLIIHQVLRGSGEHWKCSSGWSREGSRTEGV